MIDFIPISKEQKKIFYNVLNQLTLPFEKMPCPPCKGTGSVPYTPTQGYSLAVPIAKHILNKLSMRCDNCYGFGTV